MINAASWPRVLTICLVILAIAATGSSAQTGDGPRPDSPAIRTGACDAQQAGRVAPDAPAKLGLLIGIDDYASPDIRDLSGAAGDAVRVAQVIAARDGGFDFMDVNICLMTNSEATFEAVTRAFDALISRARMGDEVLIFFAGHGSQAPDAGEEEFDGLDETLVLHDSRMPGGGEIVDDWLNVKLAALSYAAGGRVTFLADSCNSGTIARTRSRVSDEYVARSVRPASVPVEVPERYGSADDRSVPQGVTVMSAAVDGSFAYERGGRGVFTDALLNVLAQSRALSYREAFATVSNEVSQRSSQIPHAEGALDREVLGKALKETPLSWRLQRVSDQWRAMGPPINGVGEGATLLVFPAGTSVADVAARRGAKAIVRIAEMAGDVEAVIDIDPPVDPSTLRTGDLAVLVQPAPSTLTLRVMLERFGQYGLDGDLRSPLLEALQAHPSAQRTLELVTWDPDYTIGQDKTGAFIVIGPQGHVLNRLPLDLSSGAEQIAEPIAELLQRHALKARLLTLESQGTDGLAKSDALKVSVVRSGSRTPWPSETALAFENGESWSLMAELGPGLQRPVRITLAVLSSDGSIHVGPTSGDVLTLYPGVPAKELVTLSSGPPFDVDDHLLFILQDEDATVDWTLLRTPRDSVTRSGTYQLPNRVLEDLGLRDISLETQRSGAAGTETWAIHKRRFFTTSDHAGRRDHN